MTDIQVRGYTRRKPEKAPDPFQPEISRRMEQMRAKANADKIVNEFRSEIGYQPRPVDVVALIAGKLKVLAGRLVS